MSAKSGRCDLCGNWSSQLLEGLCAPCVCRLTGQDNPPVTPVKRYTLELTARVHGILCDVHDMPSPAVVENIIFEALFQAALDARRGRTIQLEYIGEINPVGGEGVTYTPTVWVLPLLEEAS